MSFKLLPHKTEAFWSLTAAKPVLGSNVLKHNLQQLPLHPIALTEDTCDLPDPPTLPTSLQDCLFPTHKDLAVELCQQNLILQDWTPSFALTESLQGLQKAWLLLTCSTTSFFFAAILLQNRVLWAAVPSTKHDRWLLNTWIQVLADLHHRESFLPVSATPAPTQHPQHCPDPAAVPQIWTHFAHTSSKSRAAAAGP